MSYDILVKVGADISNYSKNMQKISQSTSQFGKQANGLTLGKMIAAVGAGVVAVKGLGMVKDSVGKAFGRIDTMERFERVMSEITGSSAEAQKALEQTNEIVKGTAYGLDIGAAAVQDFVTRGMSVNEATKTFEAFGDAVAFYGEGSNEALEGVTRAIATMKSKGKVHMTELNTLYDQGIQAPEMYAKATGKSLEEVQKGLSNGTIGADEFLDVVTTAMMEGTNGVTQIAGAAKDAGQSWGAVFDNMQAAVTRGTESIIKSIDEMLTSNGLPDMRSMVADFGSKFEEVLKGVAKAIPDMAAKIKSIADALEPWMPLIVGAVAGIASFMTVVATINTVKNAFMALRGAVIAVNLAVMANPFVAVLAVIIAVATAVYLYWEPISEFFVNLWNTIKEAGLLIWENLKQGWQDAKDNLVEAWQSVTEFFSELWQSIVDVFQAAYDWLNDMTGGTFGEYVEIIYSYLMTAWEVVKAVWGYIKETFSNVLDFLKALVTGDFQGMKDAMRNQMDAAKTLLVNIWNAIKNNFGAKIAEILSNVITKFIEIKNNIQNKMSEAKTALVNKLVEMISSTISKGANIVTAIKNAFIKFVRAVKEKATEAVKTLAQKVGEMPGKVVEKAGDMLSAGADLIKGLIEGILSMGSAAIEAITGVVGGVVSKAKSLLKIKSPSRVFMQIGEFTGEGLEQGILSMRGAVEKASDKLAESAMIEPRSVQLSYNTPSGLSSTLAGAVKGTVDVNASDNRDVLVSIWAELKNQKQMIIEMDSREVGRAVTPYVDEGLNNRANRRKAAWG